MPEHDSEFNLPPEQDSSPEPSPDENLNSADFDSENQIVNPAGEQQPEFPPEQREPERARPVIEDVITPHVSDEYPPINNSTATDSSPYQETAETEDSSRKHYPDMPDVPAMVERDFEDLTLAELINRLVRRPFETWRALSTVVNADDEDPPVQSIRVEVTPQTPVMPVPIVALRDLLARRDWIGDLDLMQLGLYITAIFLVLTGCAQWVTGTAAGRSEDRELMMGLPFVMFGLGIWALAELGRSANRIRDWLRGQDRFALSINGLRAMALGMMFFGAFRLVDASDEPVTDVQLILSMVGPGVQWIAAGGILWLGIDFALWSQRFTAYRRAERQAALEMMLEKPKPDSSDFEFDEALSLPWYMQIHPLRIFLIMAGAVLSLMTWFWTYGNQFQSFGGIHDFTLYVWLLSVVCWSLAFVPQGWHLLTWARYHADRMRSFRLTPDNRWIVWSLVLIMIVGVAFRLSHLNGNPATGDAVPPEMTSDHVEKILDSDRVLHGSRDIFFANNGGREPLQMYLMAMFSQLPGQGMTYESLKLLAVLEGLLALPVMFWLGREITGDENRRRGTIVGLLLAALVAVSYWHTTMTRLALRIILTPTITALLLIYLARGMRRNQRADFIKAGLCLGFGLYMYQAVRMLPVVIVVAMVITIYFATRDWRQRLTYTVNLGVLVLIAFVVFIPMFHYTTEQPDMFLRRTLGRLLGDDLITETLPDGTVIERYATIPEQLDAFTKNVPILLYNVRNAVLMYNWKGDVAWINGLPNYPAMDIVTGSLFLAGIVAWLALMIRKRDVVHWVMPVTLLIMLMPSALSIAYPIENPSFTRTSGSLPVAYLFAAFALALVIERVIILFPGIGGKLAAAFAAVMVVLAACTLNTGIYFGKDNFVKSYIDSSLPYSEAGQILQGFAISDGSYGNAFMIAYQYWWDHRAVGLEAGLTDWPNGIVTREEIPTFMQIASQKTDRYRYDPDKDILFFYSREDAETDAKLKEWFPDGRSSLYPSYQNTDLDNDSFMLFRVPAVGVDGFNEFLAQNGITNS